MSNQKASPVLEEADDQTRAAHPHPNFSPEDLFDPKEAKALSKGGKVAITMYGFVGADTRMPSDLAVATDKGCSGGTSTIATHGYSAIYG
jgi:hypothetical protein